jgi:hypothetical protein
MTQRRFPAATPQQPVSNQSSQEEHRNFPYPQATSLLRVRLIPSHGAYISKAGEPALRIAGNSLIFPLSKKQPPGICTSSKTVLLSSHFSTNVHLLLLMSGVSANTTSEKCPERQRSSTGQSRLLLLNENSSFKGNSILTMSWRWSRPSLALV